MPAKTQDPPAAAPPPTPEEAERAVIAGEEPVASEAGEVRAEEFTAGIGQPVAGSAWPQEIVDELRKPLDPNRVRSRAGRGSGKFEYLAGHDIKRRASEIFGFGNWGHHVSELAEIAAVQVKNNDGKEGWHVGYRCHVSIWIRHGGGVFSTDGIGYGDGVEYTPGARVSACELAMKEAETDALKRAFTDLGDQFGLILYAKGDEKAKINRERAADSSSHAVVRREAEPNVPKNWTEILTRFDSTVGANINDDSYDSRDGDAAAWLEELVEKHCGQPSLTAVEAGKRQEVFQLFSSVLLMLESELRGDGLDLNQRESIRKAIAAKFGGLSLEGPPWRLGPNEQDRPVKGEHIPAAPDGLEVGTADGLLGESAEPSEASVAEAEYDREKTADRT